MFFQPPSRWFSLLERGFHEYMHTLIPVYIVAPSSVMCTHTLVVNWLSHQVTRTCDESLNTSQKTQYIYIYVSR